MRKIAFIIGVIACMAANAQSGRKITREEYIETYKALAMTEMTKSGIPASITLAQGILESGNGNSTLARKANNHFGIKCHNWEGKSVRHDDDAKNECFRKYKSADESYHDHSEFLTTRGRYASLFELEQDDYKAWAKGLKKAGYATSPTYADALIKLIEKYELNQYDEIIIAQGGKATKTQKAIASVEYAGGRQVHFNNRVKYVLAREGDTFDELSEEMDLFAWQLPKYNDQDHTKVFAEGEKIYLQPKRTKAETQYKTHMVKEGEALVDISQVYAIRLDKLREKNLFSENQEPETGQVLLLRKRLKKPVSIKETVQNIEVKEEEEEDSEFQIRLDELEE